MKRDSERSCARLAGWLLLAGLIAALIGTAALGAVLWQQQAAEVADLRLQVQQLVDGSRRNEEHLAAVQATAATLEGRLAAMDQAAPLLVEVTPSAPVVPAVEAWPEVVATQAALDARVDALERQVVALAIAGTTRADEAGALDPSMEPDAPPPDSLPRTVRLTVPVQRQTHTLSCESAAASMAARYHGVDASEEEVLAALPRHDNPHLGFRGNVDGAPGGTTDYGVYAAPVARVLADHGLAARLVAGGMSGIRAALARGNPVVAWVTYDCLPSTPLTVTVSGEAVVLVPYQHAVVVTGYDGGGVWANDPWDGAEKYYRMADFERALEYFDQMAIEVAGD